MNYLRINNYDTNNGDGFRVSLFVSGCGKKVKCKCCQNKEGWDFKSGYKYTKDTEDYIISLLSQPLITGFSLIGGEPMDNICDELINLLKRIKIELPHISVYCWTGYTYEYLINNRNNSYKLLKYIDMLRDGEFILELKDLNQFLQGSSNQRYINVQESLKQNKTIEFNWREGVN